MEGKGILDRVTRIVEKLTDGPDNRLWPELPEPAWSRPKVGLCRADDEVFMRFKEAVGLFHWAPQEAYHLAFPETQEEPKNLAVIVWILPQTEKTKQDNRREKLLPAERWARSRIFGESFNNKLRERVAKELTEQGYPAVARMPVPAINRPYETHYDYCLFLSQGTCGRCIERCPVDAISKKGHDKTKCREYLMTHTKPYVTQKFGFEGYGCGLCQTDVPCESAIPLR